MAEDGETFDGTIHRYACWGCPMYANFLMNWMIFLQHHHLFPEKQVGDCLSRHPCYWDMKDTWRALRDNVRKGFFGHEMCLEDVDDCLVIQHSSVWRVELCIVQRTWGLQVDRDFLLRWEVPRLYESIWFALCFSLAGWLLSWNQLHRGCFQDQQRS